jgi:hypothetical protein
MERWEYTTVQMVAAGFEDPDENDNYHTIMNQFGEQGWELVSAVSYPGKMVQAHIVVLFFKRLRAA